MSARLAAGLVAFDEVLSGLATRRLAIHLARHDEHPEPGAELAGLEAAVRDVVPGLPGAARAAAVLRTAEVLVDEHLLEVEPERLTEPVSDLAEQAIECFKQLGVLARAHYEDGLERCGVMPPMAIVQGRMRRGLVQALAELEKAWPAEELDDAADVLEALVARLR